MSCAACPRALNGWFRGCVTAAVTLAALPVFGMVLSLPYRGFESLSILIPFVLFFLPVTLIMVCLLSAIPAALVIMFGEAFRIRSVLFYVPAGTAIGGFIWRITVGGSHPLGLLFLLASALAGFAYWSVAGRYAGDDGRRLRARQSRSEKLPPPRAALRVLPDR